MIINTEYVKSSEGILKFMEIVSTAIEEEGKQSKQYEIELQASSRDDQRKRFAC